MFDKKMVIMGATVGAAVGAVTGVTYYWLWKNYLYFPVPNVWEEAGEVVGLTLYPIKSGQGVNLQEAQATRYGLRTNLLQDRSFLVVKNDGTMITNRQAGRLVTVSATLTEDCMLTLDTIDGYGVTVDLKKETKGAPIIHTKIWNERAKGVDCGNDVAEWLSDVLYKHKIKVRLITKTDVMEGRPPRRLPYHKFPRIKDEDSLYYADTTAFHVANEDSLAHLNARVFCEPLQMSRFRPNIVVGKTKEAFIEDTWVALKIGDVVIRKIKPCERCNSTMVNPENGERNEDEEPLTTLRSYRIIKGSSVPAKVAKLWGLKPIFGGLFALDNPGTIKVGDKVFAATEASNPHIKIF